MNRLTLAEFSVSCLRRILHAAIQSVLLVTVSASALAQQSSELPARVPDGYQTPIPEAILTPNTVQTKSLGTLEFRDGFPTKRTADKVYDHLTHLRAVEVFLNFLPACSLEAIRTGHAEAGIAKASQIAISEQLMDSKSLFLTGSTDTVYCSTILDLRRDGPTVVEIPPGCGPGTVNDAFFRFVVDMGGPGPDRGQGGKYLILPPDYRGMSIAFIDDNSVVPVTVGGITQNYFVIQSASHTNWLILRGMLVDGKPDASIKMFRDGLKIYSLKHTNDPPPMEFVNLSKKNVNTIHPNNELYYEDLNRVIQREPLDFIDPELRGLASSIGIEKGKEFAPDARMKAILKEAASVGNAAARAIAFDSRNPDVFIYRDSRWKNAFVGGDYRWLKEAGVGGRYLDARILFHYIATVNTPALAARMVGVGSQYATCERDSRGQYLDGGRNYRLEIPANVPAEDFWSVVVYDPQTRSQLQTGQPFPSRNNKRDRLKENSDGSVTLHFGPSPPKSGETNWIQTVPGKGWFTILRLYGPQQPWFERTWKPGEIELLN